MEHIEECSNKPYKGSTYPGLLSQRYSNCVAPLIWSRSIKLCSDIDVRTPYAGIQILREVEVEEDISLLCVSRFHDTLATIPTVARATTKERIKQLCQEFLDCSLFLTQGTSVFRQMVAFVTILRLFIRNR